MIITQVSSRDIIGGAAKAAYRLYKGLEKVTNIKSYYFGGYKRYFQPMQIENLLIGHFLVYIDNAMHWTENKEAFKQLKEPIIRLFTSIFRRILMGHLLVDLVCKNAKNPYLNIEKKLFVIEVAM